MTGKPTMIVALCTCTAALLFSPAATLAAGEGGGAPEPRPLSIEMGAPFHDHAILQRDMNVPVWGWSKPGAKVSVSFAGQKKTATAGKDGKWMIELDPLKANAASSEMIISDSTGKTETLKDILVGEVWMCSGQSNMQWPAQNCVVGRKLIPEILARVEDGKETRPIIREGKVTNKFSSLYPTYRAKGQWSDNWQGFSAIAFAFAYDLAKELQIPIGIVNCAFSTTQIQAWVPREGFAGGEDEYTKAIFRKILEGDTTTPEHKAAWDAYEQALLDWAKESAERVKEGLKPMTRPSVPGNLNGNRDATWMCNGKMTPMAPYAIRGAIWNQGYANGNEGIPYRNNLHSLVRGWRTIFNQPDLPVYFHQFYCAGKDFSGITLNSVAEMRMGTWLAHMDIPNAAMASQVDITGGVHYYNKAVPGQRLARHALKNQYPSTTLRAGGLAKDMIANSPMYKGYKVKGDKLILELDHAAGLTVGKSNCGSGIATPTPIKDGEDQVELFYIAGKDRAWYLASVEIKGETIVLTASGLKEPCGVAYGCNGVGGMPSIYNEAMLPLIPFIVYDHKLVVSDQWELEHVKIPGFDSPEIMTWPMEYIPIAGKVVDPTTYGLQYEHSKLWLLSPQFANNAVIQAGVPTRFYGMAVPNSVVTVSFNGVEKSITMGAEQDEWELTFPAMDATAKPLNLHAICTLDGKVAHERKLSNIVIGDVWYVACHEIKVQKGPGVPKSGPAPAEAWTENPQLRMLMSGGRRAEAMPTRYKMNASGWPGSRFFSRWSPTIDLTKELATQIHAKTGKPVGIVILDPGGSPPIKDWVGYEYLPEISAWKADADELKPLYASDPAAFLANARTYIEDWQAYWKNVANDPAFETGAMPGFPGAKPAQTSATKIYNQSICAFSPGNFKGILSLTGKGFVAEDEGANFGPQFTVAANCWKDAFARGNEVIDPHLIYAMPSKAMAPKLTTPKGIKGKSTAIELKAWPVLKTDPKTRQPIVGDDLKAFLDKAVETVYK